MIGKIHVLPASQRVISNGVIDSGYTSDSATNIPANSFIQITDSINKQVSLPVEQVDGVTLDALTSSTSGRVIIRQTGGA